MRFVDVENIDFSFAAKSPNYSNYFLILFGKQVDSPVIQISDIIFCTAWLKLKIINIIYQYSALNICSTFGPLLTRTQQDLVANERFNY